MHHFQQTEAWDQLQQEANHHIAWAEGTLYIEQSLPFGHYLSCPRCSFSEKPTLPQLGRPVFIRFQPTDEPSLEQLQKLGTLVSVPAAQVRQTLLLDLRKSEEVLLAEMHSKHRYNIRLAEKHEVQVDCFEQYDETAFNRFWSLMQKTAERQDIRNHSRSYHQKTWEVLAKAGMAQVLIARKGQEDLATLLLVTDRDTATYLYGGSSEQQRSLMAPYLLQWRAIQAAKAKNCSFYDFWGVHTKDSQPIEGDPTAGVTRFKLGFGGKIVDFPGSWDFVLQPFWYGVYKTVRRLRGTKFNFA